MASNNAAGQRRTIFDLPTELYLQIIGELDSRSLHMLRLVHPIFQGWGNLPIAPDPFQCRCMTTDTGTDRPCCLNYLYNRRLLRLHMVPCYDCHRYREVREMNWAIFPQRTYYTRSRTLPIREPLAHPRCVYCDVTHRHGNSVCFLAPWEPYHSIESFSLEYYFCSTCGRFADKSNEWCHVCQTCEGCIEQKARSPDPLDRFRPDRRKQFSCDHWMEHLQGFKMISKTRPALGRRRNIPRNHLEEFTPAEGIGTRIWGLFNPGTQEQRVIRARLGRGKRRMINGRLYRTRE